MSLLFLHPSTLYLTKHTHAPSHLLSSTNLHGNPRTEWFVSTQDCALLHIAAAIYDEVSSERIFAYAEPWDFNKVLAIMRKAYPDRKFPDDVTLAGPDMVKPPRERAEEVLRWIKGGKGWDSLEESVKEAIAQWA